MRNRRRGAATVLAAMLAPLLFPARALAQDAVDSGNTAWLLTSSAFVLLMTLPGLALFYGGMVRTKNILSVLMQCLVTAGAVGIVWVLVGYSLVWGEGNAFIGGLEHMGLAGITPSSVTGSVPTYAFVAFQGMFVIITPALMLGAVAERLRFTAFLSFVVLWVLFVYCPLAHMVWAEGGWLESELGALDFAGGLVVHMASGFSALAAAIFIGKRRGFGREPMPPNSLPFTVIGAALLWVGWFGLNAGSEAAANGISSLAFLTTQIAAATCVLSWAIIERFHRGKPTVFGAATGAVAGLVAITPACAYVSPMGAIAVGVGAAVFCYAAVTLLKPALSYDDSLDVFGVHGIGGAWGALATGLFISGFALDPEVGRVEQTLSQLSSIGFTAVYVAAVTWAILFVLKLVLGDLRVSDEAEYEGLDLSEYSETAYGSYSPN